MANSDFKGVWIPREIWDDEKLNMLEKAILCAISNLDVSEDGCWASNEYLARFCHCSAWKVSDAVSKLNKLGYIEVIAFNGHSRKLRSKLEKTTGQSSEKPKTDMGKTNDGHGKNPEQNLEDPKTGSGKTNDSQGKIQGQTWEIPEAALGNPQDNNIKNNKKNRCKSQSRLMGQAGARQPTNQYDQYYEW